MLVDEQTDLAVLCSPGFNEFVICNSSGHLTVPGSSEGLCRAALHTTQAVQQRTMRENFPLLISWSIAATQVKWCVSHVHRERRGHAGKSIFESLLAL